MTSLHILPYPVSRDFLPFTKALFESSLHSWQDLGRAVWPLLSALLPQIAYLEVVVFSLFLYCMMSFTFSLTILGWRRHLHSNSQFSTWREEHCSIDGALLSRSRRDATPVKCALKLAITISHNFISHVSPISPWFDKNACCFELAATVDPWSHIHVLHLVFNDRN